MTPAGSRVEPLDMGDDPIGQSVRQRDLQVHVVKLKPPAAAVGQQLLGLGDAGAHGRDEFLVADQRAQSEGAHVLDERQRLTVDGGLQARLGMGQEGIVVVHQPVGDRDDGVRVRAGLFDDPFFFDSAGLRMSRSSGSLMFDRNRNFFGGQNLTAVVMEIPRDRISSGTNPVGVWSTAARIGGQI